MVTTFDQKVTTAQAEMQSRAPELTDFSDGSVNNAVAGGGAVLADSVEQAAIDEFRKLWISKAEEDELDDLIEDRLGGQLPRIAASASIGTVTWTRGSAVGAYTIPAGTVFQAEDADGVAVDFLSTASVPVGAGDSSVSVAVQCNETGRAGNVDVGTVTAIATPVASDPDATVTNAARMAGGAPVESDERYRERYARFVQRSRGTRDGLITGALGVSGVSIAAVDEFYVESSGIVYLYIGDPDVGSNASLVALVQAEMVNWAAAGARVIVQGTAREDTALTLALEVSENSDLAALESAAAAAVEAFGDTLAPAKCARLSQIAKAALNAADEILDATVTSHAANLEPSARNLALRFPAGGVTVNATVEAC